MPRPLKPGAPDDREPITGPVPYVRATDPGDRRDHQDSRGHELALQLPDWDLVPPTEFLDRARGRGR